MSPLDYPKPIRELWAYHKALRRLGFEAKDIYVSPRFVEALTPPHVLSCILQAQGLEFTIDCGQYTSPIELEAAVARWTQFVLELPAFSHMELMKVFESSGVWRTSVDFVLALKQRGFSLTRGELVN